MKELRSNLDNAKMIVILKEMETDLLKDLKDNEAVIRVPMKVTFDADGKLSSTSGVDTKQFYEKYNK